MASTQMGQRAPPSAASSLSSLVTARKKSTNDEALFSNGLKNNLGMVPGFANQLLLIGQSGNRKITNTPYFCDIIAKNAYLGVLELRCLMVPVYSKGNVSKIVKVILDPDWKLLNHTEH